MKTQDRSNLHKVERTHSEVSLTSSDSEALFKPVDFLLTVVIPVYNERQTIQQIIDMVRRSDYEKEIILVDDHSTDGTRELLQRMESHSDLKIFYHAENQGKGAALASGFRHATGDAVLIQDADLEYDPSEYQRLIEPIRTGKADVVYGSRFLGGGPHRVHLFWHLMGNRFLTLCSNMFTNLSLTDMETCYKAFKREVIQDITIQCKRFGVEPELTAKVARSGVRIYEVPISYYGRDYSQGKKIGWKDGVSALWWILRFGLFKW